MDASSTSMKRSSSSSGETRVQLPRKKRKQQNRRIKDIFQEEGVYTTICEFLPLGDRHAQRRISRWFSEIFPKRHRLFLPVGVAQADPIYTLRRGDLCSVFVRTHVSPWGGPPRVVSAHARVSFSTRYLLRLRTCLDDGGEREIGTETYHRCLESEPDHRSSARIGAAKACFTGFSPSVKSALGIPDTTKLLADEVHLLVPKNEDRHSRLRKRWRWICRPRKMILGFVTLT